MAEEAQEGVIAAAVALTMEREEAQTEKAAQMAQRERAKKREGSSGGGSKTSTPASSPDKRKADALLAKQLELGAVPGPGLSICVTVLRAEKLKDQALFTKMDP